MNNKQYIELITAYVDGSIGREQRAELNRLIDEGKIDTIDIKEMEALYKKIGELPQPSPSDNMRKRFYTMLEKEQEKHAHSSKNSVKTWVDKLRVRITVRQLGFAASIFLIGILVGNWATPFQNYRQEISSLSIEISQMREVMMMSMLDDKSATERLKAVNISSEIHSADDRVAQALLKTLNNDPNVNVRLAAVEALMRHASAPNVRKGLIAAIDKQESPLVQVALADAMLTLQEKRSIDEFQKLLDQEMINPGVRDKLENTIAALS